MGNLDDFLNTEQPQVDDPAPADPPVEAAQPEEVVEAPTEPTTAERPRGPDGKFIPKGEPAEPDTGASPAPQEAPLDHPALLGERRRRQEAEARIEALERQFAEFKPQPAPEPQPTPDLWEDPDAFIAERIKAERAAIIEEVRNEMTVAKFKDSAEAAREKYSDYDDTITHFHQMAASNPMLQQQVLMAKNPAEFAYSTAKTALEVTQYGSIESMVNARVAEALKAQTPAPTQVIPDTLADSQSARGATTEASSPPTLDQILKR